MGLAGVLNGFTGVGMCGSRSLGYFNAKADWNIDIMGSVYTPPSTKERKGLEHTRTNSLGFWMRTNEIYRPPPWPDL